MKRIVYFLIIILLFSCAYFYKENIIIYYNEHFSTINEPSELIKNEYYRNYNFKYISNTEDFNPKSKQDLMNIYYTVINSGMTEFTFYCNSIYEQCHNDVKDIANNQNLLSSINDYVHPFNEYRNILTSIDSIGKVTITVEKNYSNEDIYVINNKVDEIIRDNITSNMSSHEKIKVIHDYILNNTKYDKDRSDKNIIKYKSDTAYGVLFEGYGLCSGYTDTMMLFLEKFNIKNYKISTTNHIWNSVYLDNAWYNLDLTWDDPITSNNTDIIKYTFFLVNDEEMLRNDQVEHQHDYDKTVYSE